MDATKYARHCILDIKDYVPGKPVEEVQRELGLEDIIKLASNENQLGPSPLALQAMIKELNNNANFYPEGPCTNLTNVLAEKLNLKPEQFIIDNGVDGVITLIGLAFIDHNDEVICGQYTFPAYASVTKKMDGVPIIIPNTPDYRLDIDAFIKAITPKTKLIFLCNPNNPTGSFTKKNEFDRLINAIPDHTLLISDEAYYEYAIDPDYPQTIPYLAKHPNLIILRTFSKIMGLAGVRIGYSIAHPDIIRMIMKVREPFPVNRIAQAGALASLQDTDFTTRSLQTVNEGKKQLAHGFQALDLKCYPSQTNFVLVDLGRPSQEIFEKMLLQGVIIRPLGPQGLPTCLRFTVGTAEQNERALFALAKALGNL